MATFASLHKHHGHRAKLKYSTDKVRYRSSVGKRHYSMVGSGDYTSGWIFGPVNNHGIERKSQDLTHGAIALIRLEKKLSVPGTVQNDQFPRLWRKS